MYALYSAGLHYEINDNYPKAYEYYQKAYALAPTNETLLLRQVSTLVMQRETAQAITMVENHMAKNPTAEETALWLANLYTMTGQLDEVERIYRHLTLATPEKQMGWELLYEVLVDAGRQQEALEVLEDALKKVENPPELYPLLTSHYIAMAERPDTSPENAETLRNKAIALYESMLDTLPADTQNHLFLGNLYLQAHQYEKAVELYHQLDEDNAMTRKQFARHFLQKGDQDRAIEALQALVEIEPEKASVHLYLGELYLELKRPREAIPHFQAAIASAPQDASAWMTLAILQAETDRRAAIETLDQAIATLPTEAKLYEIKGLVYLEEQEYQAAYDLFQQAWTAIADEPSDDSESGLTNLFLYNSIFYNAAIAATHLQRPEEAAGWLWKSFEHDRNIIEYYVHAAIIETNESYVAAANEALIRLQQKDEQSAFFHAILGTFYLAKEHYSLALEHLNTAERIATENPMQVSVLTAQFFFWTAMALDNTGRTDEAIPYLESAIKLDSRHANARNYLAYTWALRNEKLNEALLHIQIALAMEPDNSAYLDTIGWVYYQMGQYEKALVELEKANQLRPGDSEITGHLQAVRERLGETGETAPVPNEAPPSPESETPQDTP